MSVDLISPIKRHLTNWIKKEDPTICCLQDTHLIDRNKHWLRVKDWKKIYQANGPQRQAVVAILRQSRCQSWIGQTMQRRILHTNKREIHQREVTIDSLYAPNVSAPSFNIYTVKDLKLHI
jgi:exonuclease III